MREKQKQYFIENIEKVRERKRRWQKANPEKIKKYREDNAEYIRSQRKKYREKNPYSATKEMTSYRRKHKKCEFGYCMWSETKTLHVHHILPKFKYPESINGNYNGRIGNNFISYCPFHHLAYHYSYANKRKDQKHENALGMLNRNMEDWALKNKISIEDLDLELTQLIRN